MDGQTVQVRMITEQQKMLNLERRIVILEQESKKLLKHWQELEIRINQMVEDWNHKNG